MPAPPGLRAGRGEFIRIDIRAAGAAHESWSRPVHAYLKRLDTGWTLVGFERQPDTRASRP
jgi:hypothetical protein